MKEIEESSPFDAVNLLLHPQQPPEQPRPNSSQDQPRPNPSLLPSQQKQQDQFPLIKIYDLNSKLLYITCSVQLQALIKKDWFRQPLIMNVEWYPSAGQATDAKTILIDKESPAWNKRKF